MNATADNNTDRILKIMSEIVELSADGDYIFRGESKCHPKVSSSLYCQYPDVETEHFDIEVVQRDILQEAKKHTGGELDDFEILTQLQHYGGKTNLIDFTTDFLRALFFACDGHPDKDGRVILQRREPIKEQLKEPRQPRNRVISQKSIFVQPPKGFIEPDDVVLIPHDLKQPILNHLRQYHDISTVTIYNDLHGFITTQRIHENSYTEFFRGLTRSEKGDTDKAIYHYTKAIELNPNLAPPYFNRGNAYRAKDEFDLAIADYTRATELNPNHVAAYNNRGVSYRAKGETDLGVADYTRAIELDPNHTSAYYNRGNAYWEKNEFGLAIADHTRAIELNPNDGNAYYIRGLLWLIQEEWDKAESDLHAAENKRVGIAVKFDMQNQVEDFEETFGVELPKHIKAMLTPQQDASG